MARSAIAALLVAAGLAVFAAPAVARISHDGSWSGGAATFNSRVFATGNDITHAIPVDRETISQPDDITYLHGRIFVGFQNGVGPQGQASTIRQRDSTVVEFDRWGSPVGQWDVVGKCDGLTADPATGR